MSGGSHDYLYVKDADQLLDADVEMNLEAMINDLAAVGYAEDAARESDELLLMMRQFRVRAGVRISRLRVVWKAMEWWKSYDWSEESFKDALDEYREKG